MTPEAQRRTPGTWRVSDGSACAFDTANAAWSTAARDVLIRTAKKYHGFTTYGQLAEEVQVASGIRTRSQMRNWIGAVLGTVAEECHRRGEPALTALCVHQDETVGVGYAYVLKIAGEEIPDDLDVHAAAARFTCHQYFGAEIPIDGGHAALTPKVAAARNRAVKKAEPTPALCPKCFVQVPTSGMCDTCG